MLEPVNGVGEIRMNIIFNTQTGAVGVQGPIQDKILCYGLLKMAEDAIRDFKPKMVEVPKLIEVPNLKRS